MAWSASKGFRQVEIDILKATTVIDYDAANMMKLALFNNTITPDPDVAAASSAYNTGVWLVAAEQSQAVQWPAGGVVVANLTITAPTTLITMIDADDTASGSACTLSNVYGGLVYADGATTPVADQGIMYLYFGGTGFAVTSGTLTVVYSGNGLLRYSH